mgnify:CR=1 FL=1
MANTINKASSAALHTTVQNYYDGKLLMEMEKRLVYYQGGQRRSLPKGSGRVAEFWRYEPFDAVTTALTEGVVPDGQTLSMSKVTAEVKAYGGYVATTDVLDLTGVNTQTNQLVHLMARQGALSVDHIVRDVIFGGTSAMYCGKKAARDAVTAADKLTVEEMPASSRRYPWVAFAPDREVGKDILFVTDVSKTIDGVKVLDKVSFIVGHGDKIAFVGENELAQTTLFKILMGEMEPDEGTVKWGVTASQSYFTDAVIDDVASALVEKYGLTDITDANGKVTTAFEQGVNMVYGKGYKIYTTQNPTYQKIAEEVCSDTSNLPYTTTYTDSYGETKTEQLQVGMTIVDPYTGYVVAMVGGAGVKQVDRGWNWATSARQCGSAIKPVSVYAPALDDGTINGASAIDDYPVMVLNGSAYPKNSNGRYMGLTPLHTAIARSTNTCAVRVVQEYGTGRSYDFMTNKLGFTTLTYQDSQQVGNMGLGGLDRGVTTEEMAAAFGAFTNQGVYTAPRTFVRVEDPDGNVVLENEAKSSVAMKDTTAALMNSLLQEVVNGGTGYEGRISGMHVAGKTGTTNNDQDRYFVGYTPYYSCAVWVGYVHNQRIVASGNPAASMWQKVMSRVHEGLEDKDFFSCSGLTYVSVCADSGLLATENCAMDCRGSRVYSALVAADNAPSASCNLHTSPDYTVAFVDDNGETTMASGSILNYERQRLPGYEDLEAEDDFMLLYGGTSGGDDDWDGFFGGSDDDEDDDDVHTSWWG